MVKPDTRLELIKRHFSVRFSVALSILVLITISQVTTAESGCMYPTRPLINGQCDNSDPAVPETIKDAPQTEEQPTEMIEQPKYEEFIGK